MVSPRLTTVIACLAVLAAAIAHRGSAAEDRFTEPSSGVTYVFGTEESMFPHEWRGGEIQAQATEPDPAEAERSRRVVLAEMATYPAELLGQNLRRVYVVGEVRFYGLPYGGTNSLDTVYLGNRGAARGYTDDYLRRSFHHEFSSILLRNYARRFDHAAWNGANPAGFRYLGDGTLAVKAGVSSTRLNRRLYADGFLTQYSQASMEEDFNLVVENLFAGDHELWRACERSERVAKKVRLVVNFYRGLDERFTDAFFRRRAAE